jgi:hypothetical protein
VFTTIAAVATLGVTGIYFETRTCSIYAGPCHYNSEIMTDGRGAIVALGFESGQGLDGLAAAAVVLGDVNLNLSAKRKAVIYIDSAATEEQGRRMTDYLKWRGHSDRSRNQRRRMPQLLDGRRPVVQAPRSRDQS